MITYVDGIPEEHDTDELMLDEESLQLGLLETVLKALLILANIYIILLNTNISFDHCYALL